MQSLTVAHLATLARMDLDALAAEHMALSGERSQIATGLDLAMLTGCTVGRTRDASGTLVGGTEVSAESLQRAYLEIWGRAWESVSEPPDQIAEGSGALERSLLVTGR